MDGPVARRRESVFDENTVRLAVIAHVRHTQTQYDEFLAKGYEREEAREQVEEQVMNVLGRWEGVSNTNF